MGLKEASLRRRIGVYGGTFDPIHNGHLSVAAAVREAFALEQILFVPAFVPPHKRGQRISSSYHRYAMAALATEDAPAMMVSAMELEAPAKPYTIETLHSLQAEQREAQLLFIMGADSFADVTSWHEHERLLSEYDIIVAARPGYCKVTDLIEHLAPRLQAQVVNLLGGRRPKKESLTSPRIYLTDYVVTDVAATEIREAVSRGRAINHLVPQAVARYIEKYGLYQALPQA
jgi:nicotinate-nucleotide adenylyltransferase